jgi:multidrug efflux pump
MSPSRPFIMRPVATALLMVAIVLAGIVGFRFLPLSALPQVDYPTIQVQTLYPGASPGGHEPHRDRAARAPVRADGRAAADELDERGRRLDRHLAVHARLTLDIAEQEVQAAINAGGSLLPADLPAPPVYAKVNPADAPVLTLAISSDTLPLTEVQNLVNTRPRAEDQPGLGGRLGLAERRAAAGGADPGRHAGARVVRDRPRHLAHRDHVGQREQREGSFDGPRRAYTINANDQLLTVDDYRNLIVAYRNGAPVRLSNVARVVQSAENTRLGAWAGSHGQLRPAIILNVQRQPGANVIATVDAIKDRLPELQRALPASVSVEVLADRTTGIRASVEHVEMELLLAVVMVVLVIFAFLRSLRADR